MVIIGAKGLAKELLENFILNNEDSDLVFFDDVNFEDNYLFGKYKIFHDLRDITEMFATDNRFALGLGSPMLRYKMYLKFSDVGGTLTSSISPFSTLGSIGTTIQSGTIVFSQAVISNAVTIGKGCLIYYNTSIAHDCTIEDFVEISPGATILGGCYIEQLCHIGANSTILPNVRIGRNSIVGAGAVVTKSVPEYSVVAGVPAKVIRNLYE